MSVSLGAILRQFTMIFLSAADAVLCQIELTGWVIAFIKQYLRKYNRYEVETLRVGRTWWEVDAHRYSCP